MSLGDIVLGVLIALMLLPLIKIVLFAAAVVIGIVISAFSKR